MMGYTAVPGAGTQAIVEYQQYSNETTYGGRVNEESTAPTITSRVSLLCYGITSPLQNLALAPNTVPAPNDMDATNEKPPEQDEKHNLLTSHHHGDHQTRPLPLPAQILYCTRCQGATYLLLKPLPYDDPEAFPYICLNCAFRDCDPRLKFRPKSCGAELLPNGVAWRCTLCGYPATSHSEPAQWEKRRWPTHKKCYDKWKRWFWMRIVLVVVQLGIDLATLVLVLKRWKILWVCFIYVSPLFFHSVVVLKGADCQLTV
jgi:hypothetical protein